MKPFNRFKYKKGPLQRILSYSLRVVFIFLFISIGFFAFLTAPVLAAPVVVDTSLMDGQVNLLYYDTLLALPSDNLTVTWTQLSALPPGLALGATGVVSGSSRTVKRVFEDNDDASDGLFNIPAHTTLNCWKELIQ